MGFSWDCTDKKGKDLFDEAGVHPQALGLGDDTTPWGVDDFRNAWVDIPYKEKLADAAQDAMGVIQSMARENKAHFDGPLHKGCPHCKCAREWPPYPFKVVREQIEALLSIDVNRVHRGGGGW